MIRSTRREDSRLCRTEVLILEDSVKFSCVAHLIIHPHFGLFGNQLGLLDHVGDT